MRGLRGAGVVCSLITEGEWCKSVWGIWGPEEGFGWGRGAVESVRGVQEVACSSRN
jgi:hypothetical protein